MATTDEIMAGPWDVYAAPVDTARPDVGAAVSGTPAWILLGTQGAKNITEDGIHVILEEESEMWRGLGSTAAQKKFRTAENGRIEFELADIRAEVLAYYLNSEADSAPSGMTTVPAAAGVAGQKRVSLLRGFDFQECALLMRKSDSPYGVAFNTQWWIPRVVQNGSLDMVSEKGAPMVLAFSYEFMESPTNGFGVYEAQTALATS